MVTRRQQIIELLKKDKLTAWNLAQIFDVDKETILEDLQHIAKTVSPHLKMMPAVCKECGFVFKERSKIKTPSKCPKCKKERIQEPLFWIG